MQASAAQAHAESQAQTHRVRVLETDLRKMQACAAGQDREAVRLQGLLDQVWKLWKGGQEHAIADIGLVLKNKPISMVTDCMAFLQQAADDAVLLAKECGGAWRELQMASGGNKPSLQKAMRAVAAEVAELHAYKVQSEAAIVESMTAMDEAIAVRGAAQTMAPLPEAGIRWSLHERCRSKHRSELQCCMQSASLRKLHLSVISLPFGPCAESCASQGNGVTYATS